MEAMFAQAQRRVSSNRTSCEMLPLAGIGIRNLFPRRKRPCIARHAPVGLHPDDLSTPRPNFVIKLRFWPSELKWRAKIKLSIRLDGSQVLDLSTKCTQEDVLGTALEPPAFVARRGIEINADKQPKTKSALVLYPSELTSQEASINA